MKTTTLLLAILFAAGLTNSRAQDIWAQKDKYPGDAGAGLVGFSIGNKGYMGLGLLVEFKKDFWEFDPSTGAWTQKAAFGGEKRYRAVGFSIGNKGYVGTGYGVVGGLATYWKDFWEYDPIANTWTKKAPFKGTARVGAAGFSIGTKGYIGTGYDFNGKRKKDFWEYDPVTDTWTKKHPFKGTGRSDAVGFAIDSKGYIGTGYDINGNYTNDFWEYDPLADGWTQKTDFGGTARSGAVGFSFDNKGFIGTGYDLNGNYTNDFWEYDPLANAWTQKADFGGSARSYAAGFSVAGNGYIGTGGYNKDFWEYTDSVLIIFTGLISGSPFCPEATVDVPFTSGGVYNPGNIYTAQLSDKNGIFSAPTSIGTLSSTANSGTITATTPTDPIHGIKYRIRVVSSDPIVIGSDNGKNLKLIVCKKVSDLSASGITATSATLSWTEVSCAVKYRVRYRIQGTTSWTKKDATTTSYTITGLLANTTYEYGVRTNCTENGSSNSGFTPIQTFTTTLRLGSGTGLAGEMMTIYPDPAEDHATIQFTLQQPSHVCIKVYDASGKEIETVLDNDLEQGDYSQLLNINHFSKGVYFVKLITDSAIENQKLVVQ